MKKLPRKLPSGKKLVATAADGRIGLYCKGKPRKESSKYAIMTQRGKKSRGLMGSGGYPVAPNDLKWAWLDKEKKRKQSRRAAKMFVDPRAGRAATKEKKPLPLSEAVRCQECRKDTSKMAHAHTLAHPDKGYAQVFCCKCTRMMGYKCTIRRVQKREAEYEERWTLT